MQKLQVVGDDLLREHILRIQRLELQQEAFRQVPRGRSGRIEFLDHGQRLFHVFHGIVAGLRDFVERRRQISVLVEIADDPFRDFAHRFRADADAQLPFEVVGEARGRRKELIERRFLDLFLFPVGGAFGARIQVLREKGAEIEFIEGIGRLRLGHFFRFLLEESLVGVTFRRRVFLGEPLREPDSP